MNKKNIEFIVSTWSNGKPTKKGSGLGIRIEKKDRDKYFDNSFHEIVLTMDLKTYNIKITDGFWKNCPELRDKAIGLFLIKYNIHEWISGKTNKLILEKIDNKSFILRHHS